MTDLDKMTVSIEKLQPNSKYNLSCQAVKAEMDTL